MKTSINIVSRGDMRKVGKVTVKTKAHTNASRLIWIGFMVLAIYASTHTYLGI